MSFQKLTEDKDDVLKVRTMRMETVRVGDLLQILSGRTDDRAIRIRKRIARMKPRAKISVRASDLEPPKPSETQPAAPAPQTGPVVPALGTVDPGDPETSEQVSTTASQRRKK